MNADEPKPEVKAVDPKLEDKVDNPKLKSRQMSLNTETKASMPKADSRNTVILPCL